MDFLQKPLGRFSKFYLRVQSKNCVRKIFFIFIFRIFSDFERKNFDTFRPKIFKKLSKLPSACPQEQLVALYLFKKFWTVLDFLQKPLARFSNFYLRVESKICGRNKFFILPFWIFSDFERKGFQTFGQKTSWICQNYLLGVQRNNLWLEFFLSFESFPIFCRNHWHGSQISIYVSRVKIALETVFLFFFPESFSDFEQNIFRLLAKKLQKFVKTNFCVSRGTTCGFNFFKKGLNPFGFSAGTFGMFLKILSKCPE